MLEDLLMEIMDKNLINDTETMLYISQSALDVLLEEYKEQFAIEYAEMGKEPSVEDLSEYLNTTILIKEYSNAKEYQLLTQV